MGHNATVFTAAQFKPTEWDDGVAKARFANHFVRFVRSGFQRTMFQEWFYKRLSSCFRHIAHYNRHGFYETWFSSAKRQYAFIENALHFPCYGDPAYTYSDVERALQGWLREDDTIARLHLSALQEQRSNAQRTALAALASLSANERTAVLRALDAEVAPGDLPLVPTVPAPDHSTQESLFSSQDAA